MEKYNVICEIGKGSYGRISKIVRKSDNKILIWKELNFGNIPEKEKEFITNEINILQELNHPNIVKQYEVIKDDINSKIYIVMEYCEGGDLDKLILKNKNNKMLIDEKLIWDIIIHSLNALNYLHNEKKVLHRDIKPSNIFLDKDYNIKLGDFGLSRKFFNGYAKTVLGTPLYMPPEILERKQYNEKADIWALGCSIYELTSFRTPYEAPNMQILYTKIKSGIPQRIEMKYSDELWNFISKMLIYDYNLRPNTIQLINNYDEFILSKNNNLLKDNDNIKDKWKELILYEEKLKKKEKEQKEKDKEQKEKDKKQKEIDKVQKEKEILIQKEDKRQKEKEKELIEKQNKLNEILYQLEKEQKEQKKKQNILLEREKNLKEKEKNIEEKEKKLKDIQKDFYKKRNSLNNNIKINNFNKDILNNNNELCNNKIDLIDNKVNNNQLNINNNQNELNKNALNSNKKFFKNNSCNYDLKTTKNNLENNNNFNNEINSDKNNLKEINNKDDNNINNLNNNQNKNDSNNNLNKDNKYNNNDNLNNNRINMNNNLINKKNFNTNININNNILKKQLTNLDILKVNKSFPMVGLKNLGDTSYLNVVLQIIGSFKEFAKYFLKPNNITNINSKKEKMPLSFSFQQLFLNIYPKEIENKRNYDPSPILKVISSIHEEYTQDKRSNPNLLIKDILKTLENELNPKNINEQDNLNYNEFDREDTIKKRFSNLKVHNSIIFNTLNYFKISEYECSTCKTKKYNFTTFSYLKLDIYKCYKELSSKNNINNKKELTIYDCLNYQLIQFKKIKCNNCKKCQDKQMKVSSKIFSSPNIFLFLLDRGISFKKDDKYLKIPFLVEEKLNLINFIENKSAPLNYELNGIVSISKEDNKYISICKSFIDNQWYYFNDEKVQQIEYKNVISLNNNNNYYIPCILIYKSIKNK